ncbi:hypothetical protein C7B80_16975 [Cyanosarcina cf. burmensis CCALA 770]|nr:hypothetical protein C7B80_16975 [Cyanosarcina cf. burmensis CCALA 770]
MAGIYAIIENLETSRIKVAVQHLQIYNEEHVETASELGFAFGWVSQDDPHLFGPALDPQTGIRVISSGRVAWDEPEWQQAAKLDRYKGGLSNRLLLERYLNSGVIAIERHNGSAILLIWDPQQQQVHLLTDHLGYYPIFLYQPEKVNGCVIASVPDIIADDVAVRTTPDYVSMAEFLWQGRATPPHTYYQEVKYAGAATHCCWDLKRGTYKKREYWQPFVADCFSSLSEAVEELAAAVRRSIYIRTLPRLGPIVNYTSGGLDSRVVLAAAADPNCIIGVNLYDVPNREVAIAQQVCQTAGVKYVGFARDTDYYPQWMRLGAKHSGAMWSTVENHFLGTRELVCGQLQAQTVLSGCSTDFLFKHANLDRSFIFPSLSWSVPIYVFRSQWNGGFLDPPLSHNPRPAAFTELMGQRLQEWFAGASVNLQTDRDRLWVEDKRNRPMCYASGLPFQLMFRTFPYDSFLADRAIVDCYGRIPNAGWKLNARLWGLAIAKICGRSVMDANFGWRPGASNTEKVIAIAKKGLRKQLGLTPKRSSNELATNGSWPNMSWYICHSSTIQQMWETTPLADRQLLSELWGSDPWQLPLEQWAKSVSVFFYIATLLNYRTVRRDTKH